MCSSVRTAMERELVDAEGPSSMDVDVKTSGRRSNQRSHYIEPHPQRGVRCRVVRSPGHNTLPSVVGPFFPRPGDSGTKTNDDFMATMLFLLKPWREARQVKEEEESWQDAYDRFISGSSRRDRDVVAGVKYYYQCFDSAGRKQ